jgi:very-short-patch-repair endonuclease
MDQLNAGLTKTESPFEAEVFKILTSLGYCITPQWQVGAYRIDMVAEGNGKRLAIECDGERWHYDKAEEDLARQALLERLGWTFVRIRGSVFYRDKTPSRSVALSPLLQRLKEIGIEPNNESTINGTGSDGQTLADKVILLAAEIRVRGTLLEDAPSTLDSEISVVNLPSAQLITNVATDISPIYSEPMQTELIDSQVQVPLFNQRTVVAQQSELLTVNRTIEFSEGDRVTHPKLGLGTVKVVKRYGGQISELDIRFDAHLDIKTLTATSVKLA